ncbi:hypothetical protein RZY40_004758 [Vibrio alginolyticus]|nr:hypothetical protein [Vibrio alginolyticus]MBT0004696.1 hypothetical protein [Vibrio alginolyticus]BCG18090.1 hypothetical protein HLBS07_19420 [Vibrio alginolyticus]
MSTCNRCGQPIEFRYVGGQCVPIHPHDGCCNSSGTSVNDFSSYSVSTESACFSTSCPDCGDEVYFIRHNGGSVWIDAPLGPPWYQHYCMHAAKSPTLKAESLVSVFNFEFSSLPENSVIGVVKSCRVSSNKSKTELTVNAESNQKLTLVCKNNGGFLLGKLCVIDSGNETIYSFDEPSLRYMLLDEIIKTDATECIECGVALSKKNVKRHMRKVHGVQS